MEHIEEMSAFFTKRIDEYEAHMLGQVEGIRGAYALVPTLLPEGMEALLDLGCGTGLELDGVFARFPDVRVTGIDLAQAMLDRLAQKFSGKDLTLVCGDYLSVDLGAKRFDAALSFQTLHHFTHAEKLPLYRRIRASLRPGGVYVEADYTVQTQAEEDMHFRDREALLAKAGNPPGFFHYDTPLTSANGARLLRQAGFADVRIAWEIPNMTVTVSTK